MCVDKDIIKSTGKVGMTKSNLPTVDCTGVIIAKIKKKITNI